MRIKQANRSEHRKRTLIFILSPSYSGSTLLTFLLARHPQIATIGELKATAMGNVSEYRCSCGELITECGFWRALTEECRHRGVEFSVKAFETELRSNGSIADRLVRTTVRGSFFEFARSFVIRALPGARHALGNSIRRNYEIAEAVCTIQRKDVFLDGSKTPSRLIHLAECGMWDLKVIDLHRDGRGVSNSNRKHMGISMSEASKRWAGDATEILLLKNRLQGIPVVSIRYEDLCCNPAATLATVTDRFGLERMDVSSQSLGLTNYHILGNSMRLKSVAEIRFDDSWRSDLSAEQLAVFEKAAGQVNKKLGYARN